MREDRLILQMGMGIDAGGDPVEAARRAITDALGRVVLHVDHSAARVRVTLGVPQEARAAEVTAAVTAVLPGAEVVVREGGLPNAAALVVTAAIERFLPTA